MKNLHGKYLNRRKKMITKKKKNLNKGIKIYKNIYIDCKDLSRGLLHLVAYPETLLMLVSNSQYKNNKLRNMEKKVLKKKLKMRKKKRIIDVHEVYICM